MGRLQVARWPRINAFSPAARPGQHTRNPDRARRVQPAARSPILRWPPIDARIVWVIQIYQFCVSFVQLTGWDACATVFQAGVD
jgi:hypothetical protein